MLIVIDGVDGSGKSTQLNLLAEALNTVPASFPNYESPTGSIIQQYLNGGINLSVYGASLLYALDRRLSGCDGVLLTGRYVTSNIIHQMPKLPRGEWENYMSWIEDLEYNKLCLPRPDLVIYLDMPIAVSRALMRERGALDIYEADEDYQMRCHEAGDYACCERGWTKVICGDDNGARPISDIHDEIMNIINKT